MDAMQALSFITMDASYMLSIRSSLLSYMSGVRYETDFVREFERIWTQEKKSVH